MKQVSAGGGASSPPEESRPEKAPPTGFWGADLVQQEERKGDKFTLRKDMAFLESRRKHFYFFFLNPTFGI